MFEIRRIHEDNARDICLPNEPFALWGKMIPLYDGKRWGHTTEIYAASEVREMTFPEENYCYEDMKETCIFAGAYDADGVCAGVGIFRHQGLKYLYLEDLKVRRDFRGKGIAGALVEEGKKAAAEHGYRGICTVAQDNNLSACLFYLHAGFEVGGFNSRVYRGTSQEGKGDIFFYLDI